MSDHIVTAYDTELKQLNNLIAEMGEQAQAQFAAAVGALMARDASRAALVVEKDYLIDQLEDEVERLVIRLLALRQPMASDLRHVVGALRIASDFERIADYEANIAKRTLALNQTPAILAVRGLTRMSGPIESMIKDVRDAYIDRDANKALDVWTRDGEVDEIYNGLFRELLTYMMEDPRNISACTHLLFIAKNMERIGDHVTNIAEMVYFLATGERLGGTRPKGDTTSFEVVRPARGTPGQPVS